jgi:DNA processing protein
VLQREGCLLSELPPNCNGRRWGAAAGARILEELGQVVVLIEGEAGPRDTAVALAALQRGRAVAAFPGRVTSPLSAGPHSLIRSGATLVRGPSDVLDLLHGLGAPPARRRGPLAEDGVVPAELEPVLRDVLEALSLSDGSPDELGREGRDPGEILFALSELELRGLVVRVGGGRYLPRPDPR